MLLAGADSRARSAWRSLLDADRRFVVVAEVASGDDLVACTTAADVVVVDLTITGLNAYEAVARFRPAHPAARIVVVAPADVPYLRDAMRAAGADGYLAAPRIPGELVAELAGDEPA